MCRRGRVRACPRCCPLVRPLTQDAGAAERCVGLGRHRLALLVLRRDGRRVSHAAGPFAVACLDPFAGARRALRVHLTGLARWAAPHEAERLFRAGRRARLCAPRHAAARGEAKGDVATRCRLDSAYIGSTRAHAHIQHRIDD